MEVVRRAAEQLVDVRIAARAEQVVAAGIVFVTAVADGVGDEGDHRPQERQVAPQSMTGRDVRAVELSGAGGPEPFARIVASPQVEVDDLWAVDRREPHDLPGRHGKCVTGSTGTTTSLSRRRRSSCEPSRSINAGSGRAGCRPWRRRRLAAPGQHVIRDPRRTRRPTQRGRRSTGFCRPRSPHQKASITLTSLGC